MLDSIKDSIKLKDEILNELVRDLGKEKQYLDMELAVAPAELRDVILFRDQIAHGNKMDVDIAKLDEDIAEIQEQLSFATSNNEIDKNNQKELINNVVSQMNILGKSVDQNRTKEYNDIFAIKGQTYSGSEQQIYYFCKIVALQKYFKHRYPIVIDAFREGEISSGKESLMLKEFTKIDNQVLLSATLKEEEYSIEKYVSTDSINVIDYSQNMDNSILSQDNLDDFKEILKTFGIKAPSEDA